MSDKTLTVGELIEELSQYDPAQKIYVMAKNSNVSPVVEVSLHDREEGQGPDNPLSITTESTWETT